MIRKKGDNLYVKWKGYDSSFNSWIDKKDLVWKPFSRGTTVKVDLSNYATKADIKNISHADTSSFALKTHLANLKLKFMN